MSKTKSAAIPVRVLDASEYPTSITATRGMYTPQVMFAAIHPLGLYYVEHEGAGHLAVTFLPKRKGSRPKRIGSASSMEGAFRRISTHEDEVLNPQAEREEGRNGPVNIFDLGKRTNSSKVPTDLDRELDRYLKR